jgi:hypothetical protein
VIVAVPFATALTRPADETVATPWADVAHVTVGLGIALSLASFTVGTSVAVSESEAKLRLVGASVTDAATWLTVAVAVAFTDPDVAVIVAVPSATAVTSPAAETVATPWADVAHVTVGLGIALSLASFTVGTSVAVSESEAKLRLVGASVTDAATWLTVAVAVAFTDPDVAVIVADPFATAVTSPADETVATPWAEVAHVTVAPDMTLSFASLTVGTSVVVSSTDEKLKLVGASVTDAATWLTVVVAVAFTDPDVAVIVADPLVIAVTSPSDETVATPWAEVAHVTVGFGIVLLFASFTVGTSVVVSSTDAKLKLVGDSVTDVATWLTVTVAFAVTEPEVANIVADPFATEVTSPADDTVAMDELDVDHVTVGLGIVLSLASLTVATSVPVSETEAKLKLVGDKVIDVATWLTVAVAVAFTEPDVAAIVAVPSATAVTRPEDDTVATDELDVVHVTVALGIVLSFASRTVATIVVVSPIDAKLRLVGDSVIDVATWLTVAVAVAFTEPDVAVIVAVPLAIAVTVPPVALSKAATDEFDDDHAVVAPATTLSFASLTVEWIWIVSPIDAKLRLVGDNVTDTATWLTVAVAVAFTDPDVATIVAVPFAIAVTSPADDTVAIDELDVVHVTVGFGIVLSLASLTVGTSVVVSSTDAKLRLVGDSVIDVATWLTVAVAVAFTDPDVAVIVADPFATAVTSPADETVATPWAEVVHVTVAPEMTLSFASFTVGTSVVVSSTDAKLRLVGASVTDAATWLTVVIAVAVSDPEVAVIVAEPSAIAVTSPADETVATPSAEVAHVTVGFGIVLLFASFTVATSVVVSSTDAKLRLVGDSVIDVATWLTVAVTVALTDPEVAVIVAVPSATAVTSPADETVATPWADVAHVTVGLGIVLLFASFAVGTSVVVSSTDAKLRLVGDKVIDVATWLTVAVAFAFTDPDVAVIVAVPSATAVTSPSEETSATPWAEVVHVTVAPEMTLSFASLTVATIVVVSPSDAKLRLVGESVTDAAAWATVAAAVAFTEPEVAVIVAVPSATVVTNPADETVATPSADVAHVTVGLGITVPPASLTVATIVVVSPSDAKLKLVGNSVRDTATWLTVTVAVALIEPEVAVSVAVPSATEVTRLADETVATDSSDVVHVTVGCEMTLPPASTPAATIVVVSPIDEKLRLVGDSVRDTATWLTVAVAVPPTEPDVAVIVAVPLVIAVTSPADDTVAVDELDVVHVTVAPEMALSFASFTVAVSWVVSPSDVKLSTVSDNSMLAAAWATVTAAVASTEPEVAVIVADPLATAVTRPADETVATDEFDAAHVTVGFEMTVPPASLTVGVSVAVSPSDEKLRLVGARVRDAATWVTVAVAVALAEPDVAVIVAVPSATAVTRPADETVATDSSDVTHVTVGFEMIFPPPSRAVATIVAVSPPDEKLRLVGASVRDAAAWLTVAVAVALTEPEVAEIVAVPPATAVTRPADETVATDSSDVAHATVAPEMAVPPASLTVATILVPSPSDVKLSTVSDNSMLAAAWATVTAAVASSKPEVTVSVAVPSATAVTRPADETVTTDEFDVAHVTVAPATTLPAASFTVAVSVAVSPIDVRLSIAGDNSTVDATWATVTAAVSLTSPEVAVIVAVPFATEVTSPADDTVVIDELDVVHVTVRFEMTLPAAFLTVAVSWVVSPSAENVSSVSDSSKLAGTTTVTEAVALSEPDVAVIVAVPSATEVTRPVEDTVTTDEDDELHATLAPLIIAPFWSLTVAESCCVASKDEKLNVVADSVIEVATGVGGVGGVVGELPPSPHAASSKSAANVWSLDLRVFFGSW